MKGKSEQATKLPCRIHTRLTRQKHAELCAILKQCHSIRTLSELVRYILDNKPVAIKTYDPAMDQVMRELGLIRGELNAIGVNINQVTRAFHQTDLPGQRQMQVLELTRLCQRTELKVNELFTLMAKLSERWLPE